MKALPLLPLLLLASCTASTHPRGATPVAANSQLNPNIDYNQIGKRVWQNECAGSVQGLVSWNAGEAFPSLGIGHFIWYPAGLQAPFAESFPSFVRYAQSQGIAVPSYFLGAAPWPNKAAFQADTSGKANAMRQWLAAHIDVQTRFLVLRSRASLQRVVAASSQKQAVAARITALMQSTQGNYCLIDYTNFKGEGLKESERYHGQGWGLLQVLEEMRGNPQGAAACAEFSRAAAAVMTRRVQNSPAERGEQRWLAGWLNRCQSYR